MIGSDRLLNELHRLVKRSKADGLSVCAHASVRHVSRFAFGTIHQDVVQESVTVYLKAIADHRLGVAVVDSLDRARLNRALDAATDIARHAPPIRDLPELPNTSGVITRRDYHAASATAPVAAFVMRLKRLFQLCQGVDAQLAGSFTTGEDELAVVNSRGGGCYAASTVSGVKLVTMYRKLSGYASAVDRRVTRLDLERLLERTLKQCLHRHEPLVLPTGTYEVILEPEAVAELMGWLGYIAFGAKSVQERTSFLAGRMGESVMGREVTIVDDSTESAGLRLPFDYEGVPKQRVTLIDRGTAAGVVYDTLYGRMYDRASTGHALSPDSTEGPLPSHLMLEPGTKRREELIRSCQRGLWIPRFHYVNGLLNPREALMTGLTREGACLIEHGKLTRPIATMRFTQSLLEAFQHMRGISKERQLIADPQELGSAVMPTVHLAKFRFTGRSEE